ncbi:MAG TPA: cache domain-containing protein [Thermomicrobiales bacterium]|jgi:signal transduction histidine kinase
MRTRFVAAASACLLPLLAVVLFVLDQSLNNSRDQLLDNEIAISNVVAQTLSQTLEDSQMLVTDLAQEPAVTSANAANADSIKGAQSVFINAMKYRSSLKGLFLLGSDGRPVTSYSIDPAPLLDNITLKTVTDNALTAGVTGVSNTMNVPNSDNVRVVALVAAVLPNADDTSAAQPVEGKPIGAVGAFLDVERLRRAFSPASELGSETTITIVSDDGTIIVDQSGTEPQSTNLSDKLAGPIAEAIAGKRSRHAYRDANGDERLAVVAPVAFEGARWAVLVTSPSPTAYLPNRNLLQRGLIALAAAVTLTLALAVLFGEMTARPLRQLTRQAKEVAGGHLDEPLQPVGRGEVASLSAAIRDMAYRLTRQVSDTETAREEVARQAELLRDLLRRTVRLQEDERRRIAGDIHDAVSPLITGALYQARAVTLSNGTADAEMNGHGDGNGARDEGLATVGDLLERAMAELHGVIFALRPPDLDDLGVVAAIDRYVQQINRTGLPCRLEVIGEPERLSPEARLGVYRIVQEALHNALRHAHADEALVKMEWLGDRLRVTIRDNGSGFDPEQAPSPTSLGLLSMRERAAAIGATLEIASRPGAGTAIILERPTGDDLVTEPHPDEAPAEAEPGSTEESLVVSR